METILKAEAISEVVVAGAEDLSNSSQDTRTGA